MPVLPQSGGLTKGQVQEQQHRRFKMTIRFSDLYADTKEMRPVSLHEVDQLSEEPN
jgi:hypothetical protein